MLFTIISILVPTLVYLLTPKIIRAGREWRWLLFAACFIMFTSWYIPSPKIDGQQTEFFTHFIGGGIFTGLLWLYIKLVKKWTATWWIEGVSLFALVSTLGVTNELFEFVLFKLGHMPHGISDTTYDLVANTLGALVFFAAYRIFRGKTLYADSRN